MLDIRTRIRQGKPGRSGVAPLLALGWLAPALATPAGAQDYVKWDQPPDPAQPDNVRHGWNEESTYRDLGPTMADDWVCETADPVVDIRRWGVFLGWRWDRPPALPDLTTLLSAHGSCVDSAAYSTAVDFNNEGCVNLPDLARLLSVYGQNCPTW